MKKRSVNSRKYSLLFATFVALFSICTAGVSTFAWFQAEANVQVQTTSTSTTITVAKPDDYTFYYYNGNLDNSHEYVGTFDDDFTSITNSTDLSTYTTLSSIYPGKVMVFAVTMTGCSNETYVDLKLTKLTSNTINDQDPSKQRVVRSPECEINVGWAMDIYSSAVATASADGAYDALVNNPSSLSASDKFTFAKGTTKGTGAGAGLRYSSITAAKVMTLYTPIEVYKDYATASNMTLFYAVYFSDTNSTLFKEVDSGGSGTNYGALDNAKRYFDAYSSGSNLDRIYNSNCYAGLKFQLNELSLTF